jgi:hypothetical protein
MPAAYTPTDLASIGVLPKIPGPAHRGRLSVVTYLHEFAHALGRDERGACRWSINLFRRVFPEQFARLAASGHTLRRGR